MDSFGRLIVETSDNGLSSESKLELRVVANRYVKETTYQSTKFKLTIRPCINVAADETLMTYNRITYVIGSPLLNLPTVSVVNPDCHNSYFAVQPDPLPAGFRHFNSTSTGSMSLSVEIESKEDGIDSGIKTVFVEEKDIYTGFTAKTIFVVSIETNETDTKTRRE